MHLLTFSCRFTITFVKNYVQNKKIMCLKVILERFLTCRKSLYDMLWANSADDKLMMFFLFLPRNRI